MIGAFNRTEFDSPLFVMFLQIPGRPDEDMWGRLASYTMYPRSTGTPLPLDLLIEQRHLHQLHQYRRRVLLHPHYLDGTLHGDEIGD